MKLQNRVAVITGAGSGIGRVIAVAFAQEGAQLALVGRREHKLRETAELCGNDPLLVSADLRQEADVERLRDTVLGRFGRCEILVNNAGVFKPEPGVLLYESPVTAWDDVLDTNVRAAFLCLRAFVPGMIQQNYGRILSTTSGLKHAAGHGVYSVSKSALDALTKTAAQELRRYNILVNTLNPGWVRTEMATNAPEPPDKVGPIAVRLATLPPDEPSGVEFHA
ncbi:MAG: SDR family oxidoreductase [Abitibacteriaceae bacterium]|nr:SDR family oxidoreductase [Abditibacteriaceae bacterium]